MNTTATTFADTSSSTRTPQPKRAKRVIIGLLGSVVLVAGAVTATIADHGHGSSRAPGVAPALQQDKVVKADRLQAALDAGTTSGDGDVEGNDSVMAQIHALAGVSATAQQARTLLYQELRAR